MKEPCVQCGEVETDVMVCPSCRAANLMKKAQRAASGPTPKEQAESKAEIREKRILWLKALLADKGCRICKTQEPRFLMWEPIPTYTGPSIATMLNRCYSKKRFEQSLRFHVPTCWNHYFMHVAPDALYPSNFIGQD